MLDPACGTGGMLSVSEQYLKERNPDARLEVYGQELNTETYAVCRSDMMLKDPKHRSHIVHGSSDPSRTRPSSPHSKQRAILPPSASSITTGEKCPHFQK
jgi:type I restriction-modification system DNA methylase subunit